MNIFFALKGSFLFLLDMNVLAEEQAWFRKGYGTTDHIFNLKCLIDLYLFRSRKLFCAFIDYKKAFDSVNLFIFGNSFIVITLMVKCLKLSISCMPMPNPL